MLRILALLSAVILLATGCMTSNSDQKIVQGFVYVETIKKKVETSPDVATINLLNPDPSERQPKEKVGKPSENFLKESQELQNQAKEKVEIEKIKEYYISHFLIVETDKYGKHNIIMNPKILTKPGRIGQLRMGYDSQIEDMKDNRYFHQKILNIQMNLLSRELILCDVAYGNGNRLFFHKGNIEVGKVVKLFQSVPESMHHLELSEKSKFVIDNLK
ncbi:hypothetical protein AAEX28_12970 [Lentisphaerota bacterium WC36G]|nr:hypothetical protein LJT99_15790 [Lentisphaerae bacterium WC36]